MLNLMLPGGTEGGTGMINFPNAETFSDSHPFEFESHPLRHFALSGTRYISEHRKTLIHPVDGCRVRR